ncbi:MAG: hypothetical protein V7727_18620 [Sneathiella sp.]
MQRKDAHKSDTLHSLRYGFPCNITWRKLISTLDKTVFGIAALLLLVIGATGVLPSFLEALQRLPFEGKLTVGDFIMAMVTVAIATFAGIQIVLQWNQHNFDRRVQNTNLHLSLREKRAEIYLHCISAFTLFTHPRQGKLDELADFSDYLTKNEHFLPLKQREFAQSILNNSLEYFRVEIRLAAIEIDSEFYCGAEQAKEICGNTMRELESWHKGHREAKTLPNIFAHLLDVTYDL